MKKKTMTMKKMSFSVVEGGPVVPSKKKTMKRTMVKKKKKRTMKRKKMICTVVKGGAVVPLKKKSVSAMDDLDQWPPVWKPLEESPEYRVIRYPLQQSLKGLTNFWYFTPMDDFTRELFIKQLQETRGYDLTIESDEYMINLINKTMPERMETFLPDLTEKSHAVVDRINHRAKNYGESYVFLDVEKAVRRMLKYLLTFRVKEISTNVLKTIQACLDIGARDFLLEWRFKPHDDSTTSS